ncbi:competence protein [Bergeriella denitrificans]|uniref:Competence protein n=2 Tax=Bergeriella denitrificans TaxID=494 RepID=A0A378UL12_BERDE|nr:competence protein [Bergeriella denitrificans]
MCGRCQKKPPAYERMWASVYYEPPVSTMIHEWKHLADLSLGGVLAGLMLRHAPDWLAAERIDYLLPVPLSKERRLFRGFNQSEGLVEHLAQHYGWRILPRDSVLRADKPPQSTLKSSERLRNVRHVFSLAQPLPPQCNILLVDDVMTTGATLAELSETLKKSGAQNVFCWTLARAQMKN